MFVIMTLMFLVLLLLYLVGTRNFDYWKERGVAHYKPLPFVGSTLKEFLQLISFADGAGEVYRNFPNEKFVGSFTGNLPVLLLRDPELVKQVMVTDFAYFYPRGLNPHKEVIEPMLKNLFFAEGDLWKLLRQRMTPAFTSGKLKAMFPLIVERTKKLQNLAAAAAKSGEEVDVRDLMARYTTDFIGACGFGIDSDSLNDEDSVFRKLGKRIFTITKRDALMSLLKLTMPELCKNLHFLAPEIEKNTSTLVKNIMTQRNYKPSGRNDFIDLLLELKEKGNIVGESVEKRNLDGTPKIVSLELDDLLMAAQVFIFFAAGFETSSSATSYTLHQLAFNPEVQMKCQEEIDSVLCRYDNTLCYDAVKELKYLEMAFKEGMRMFPPLGFLMRECAKKYTLPGTNVTLDKGVRVVISVQSLHNDEKYYDDPEEFRPERFHRDNANQLKNTVYIPFGQGPRACIGERLGLMQSLAGLAALLHRFSVAPSKSSRRKLISDPTALIVQSIKGGIPLALIERKKDV